MLQLKYRFTVSQPAIWLLKARWLNIWSTQFWDKFARLKNGDNEMFANDNANFDNSSTPRPPPSRPPHYCQTLEPDGMLINCNPKKLSFLISVHKDFRPTCRSIPTSMQMKLDLFDSRSLPCCRLQARSGGLLWATLIETSSASCAGPDRQTSCGWRRRTV